MTNQTLQFLTNTVALKVSAGILPILTWSGLMISPPSAQAAILNPGFENGLGNWTATGDVSLDTGILGSGPLFGNSQALLTTASLEQDDFPSPSGTFNFSGNPAVSTGSPSTLETALGLSAGALDMSPFLQSFEGSAIVQSFTVEEGETISFSWNFLTNDSDSDSPFTPGSPRDYAFIVLDGTIITPLADTSSPLLSSSSTIFSRETGFQTFTSTPLSAGVHTLGIGIVDIQDTASTSALLIDAPQETPVSTPEPTSKLGLFLLATLGVSSFVKRRG
ncbi:hypothetical protein [Crocosphaera chwakensis]|uniref:PEP-CTERM protein-sorting domain-containing protein n=1 Tax=Crocosphaera chwakensis CCY0110 TaxID=391612 RepID=A3ISD9_9CHRO|nr:hypothetical protein [Crocosphaera chwakensis]EAZ90655.1 hypothetical protein CY0110_08271 [Crocosphaera chwakensis CCY0110]